MTRYCFQCKFYDEAPSYEGRSSRVCRKKAELRRDLVTGRTRWHGVDIDPATARSSANLCGKDGKWFSERTPIPLDWSQRVQKFLTSIFGD